MTGPLGHLGGYVACGAVSEFLNYHDYIHRYQKFLRRVFLSAFAIILAQGVCAFILQTLAPKFPQFLKNNQLFMPAGLAGGITFVVIIVIPWLAFFYMFNRLSLAFTCPACGHCLATGRIYRHLKKHRTCPKCADTILVD